MFRKFLAVGAVVLLGGLLFGATAFAQGPNGPGGGYGGEQSFIAIAAEQLGMTRVQLVDELQTGKTIEQVAQEKGVAPQAIVDAFTAARKEWLDARVADGRLTADQAAQRLAMATEQATQHLTQPWPFDGRNGQGTGAGGAGAGIRQHASNPQHLNGPMARFGPNGR